MIEQVIKNSLERNWKSALEGFHRVGMTEDRISGLRADKWNLLKPSNRGNVDWKINEQSSRTCGTIAKYLTYRQSSRRKGERIKG